MKAERTLKTAQKNIICIVIGGLVICSLLASCAISQNVDVLDAAGHQKNSVTLTDNQIALLEEEGLPTDYNSLTLTQKSAIVAIEDMLQYLENKYGMEFSYYGYIPASGMDREHLLAVPPEGVSDLAVTVYRDYEDGQFIYSDDFLTVLAQPVYKDAMQKYFDSCMETGFFKVFTEVLGGEISENPEDILKSASGVVNVALDGSKHSENSLQGYADAFAEWYLKNRGDRSTTLAIMLVPEDLFSQLGETNYANSLNPNTYTARINCVIYGDGSTKIY